MSTSFEEFKQRIHEESVKFQGKIEVADFNSARAIIQDIIQLYDGEEKAIAALLMAQGNLFIHLAEICKIHDPSYWDKVMNDSVVKFTIKHVNAFMKIRRHKLNPT